MAYDSLPNLGSGDVLTVGWVDQAEANAAAFLGIAQPVTSLPASPSQGDTVRYAPVAAGSPPIWLCTWDTNLNGGTGAWSVTGPPIVASQGAGTVTTANNTTYTAMPAAGSIVAPVGGVYIVSAAGVVTQGTTGTGEAQIRAVHGGTSIGSMGYQLTFQQFSSTFPGGAMRRVQFAAGTVSLQVATNNNPMLVNNWTISLTPMELRP